MRKLVRFALLMLLLVGVAQAQPVCSPNPLYVLAGIPGIYPNPAIQPTLASGDQGVPYTETFTIMVPPDTTIDLSALIGFPFPPISVSVNYQEVSAITGLPSGLNYQCDPVNCQWIGGQNGCAKISGTPTQGGTFPVGMTSVYNVTIPQSVPVIGGTTQNIPIPGLDWTMDVTAVGVADQQADAFWIAHNAPNPFHGTTAISFNSPKPSTIAFEVTDLTGKLLHAETIRASAGANTFSFDASTFTPGIYLYKLSNGTQSAVSKMVVN
jgi:hypothetical protein